MSSSDESHIDGSRLRQRRSKGSPRKRIILSSDKLSSSDSSLSPGRGSPQAHSPHSNPELPDQVEIMLTDPLATTPAKDKR